jgi:hypothetical protein
LGFSVSQATSPIIILTVYSSEPGSVIPVRISA